MFRDPYSERQGLYRFLSGSTLFIGIAVVLAVIAAVELTFLFRAPGANNQGADPEAVAAGENYTGEYEAEPQRGPDTGKTPPPGMQGGDWRLVLVNESHPLPEEYDVRLVSLRNGLQVDERISDPLIRMLEAAKAEGLTPIVSSAYRSIGRQRELFDDKVARLRAEGMDEALAKAEAGKEVAFPGASEHHLGLAVDIVSYRNQRLDETQEGTQENQWLRGHCQEYGFILRYPPEKSDITGVIYESWHFRYVGVEAAGEIMAHGLCLEEYLDTLNQAGRD